MVPSCVLHLVPSILSLGRSLEASSVGRCVSAARSPCIRLSVTDGSMDGPIDASKRSAYSLGCSISWAKVSYWVPVGCPAGRPKGRDGAGEADEVLI